MFATFSRPNGSMDLADRTALLYARFPSATRRRASAAGFWREFRSGTPYAGEDPLLSPPDGRAFAARCDKAAVAAKMKAACIAEFRANELDVQIRFAPGGAASLGGADVGAAPLYRGRLRGGGSGRLTRASRLEVGVENATKLNERSLVLVVEE